MRKRLTNNLGYKILSVVFAIMLWLTVLNVSDPQKTATISNIPITILNESAVTGQDMVYKITSGKTATVEVTGPRTIIDSLEASSFEATVDLSKLSITNALQVDVELVTASYRSKVDIDVKTTMRIEVEELLEEEFTVEVNHKSTLPNGYVVHETSLEVENVKVKAPVSTMNKIAKVAVQLDLSGKTGDFQVTEKLYAFDARGNVLDAETNDITFEVTTSNVDVVIYSVKQIPITYEIVENNYENTVFVGTEISRENITIKGRKEALDTISELKLDTSALQITEEQEQYKLTYDVQSLLPEGVYLYGDEKNVTITVNTDAIITKSYTVPVADIAIKTPAEGFTAYIDTVGEITYTLKGRKSVLDAFEQEDIMLYVSAKNLVEGEYDLQVMMDLDEGIEQVGRVTVKIKVVPKETTTVEPPSTSDNSTEESSQGDTTTEPTTSTDESESSTEDETTTPVQEETEPVVQPEDGQV